MPSHRFAVSLLALAALFPAAAPKAASAPHGALHPPTTIDVAVFSVLLDAHLAPHPVPLLALEVVGEPGDTTRARTGLDGRVHIALRAGRYTVRTPFGTSFEGQQASWSVPLVVAAVGTPELVLGNDNAMFSARPGVEVPGETSSSGSGMAPGELYARLGHSVFRVQAGLARGSGFLADTLGGIILTNAHVVEPGLPDGISVFLDDTTRVAARLLAIDSDADAAAIVVAAPLLAGRARVPLLTRPPEEAIHVGDPLAALGFPLNQSLIVTSGIAASVRSGAVLSDVNLNPGNSGGPLVDARGQAVAVNTFIDAGQAGPGISGAIAIPQLARVLKTAAARDTLERPEARALPTVPAERIPLEMVKDVAARIDKKAVAASTVACGRFTVSVATPFLVMAAVRANEADVGKDRKKREEKAGLPEIERYSDLRQYRDWTDYVGAPTAPVASVTVVPNVSETSGSFLARALVSPLIRAKVRFDGDVREVLVLRDGRPCDTIVSGHAPIRMFSENSVVSFKDIADEGHCVLPIDALRPDSSGAPPSIVVAIRDLKHPGKYSCVELGPELVARAWNDFSPWFQGHGGAGFLIADAKLAKHRKSAEDADVLKGQAEWAQDNGGRWHR